MHDQPFHSQIILYEQPRGSDATLTIVIPPARWTQVMAQGVFHVVAIAILLLCIGLIAALLHEGIGELLDGAIAQGLGIIAASIALTSLVFISSEAWMVEATETVRLELDRQSFRLSWHCHSLRGKQAHIEQGALSAIREVVVYARPVHWQFQILSHPYRVVRYFPMPMTKLTTCALWVGDRPYEFGLYLDPAEQEWLIAKIVDFIRHAHSSPG